MRRPTRSLSKHLWAVEFTIRRETTRREKTVVGKGVATRTVTETVKTVETARITYRQDWPAYNAAQTQEARLLPELLHGLCQGIVQPPQGMGRPRLPLADARLPLVTAERRARAHGLEPDQGQRARPRSALHLPRKPTIPGWMPDRPTRRLNGAGLHR
jgi:hypothetical protein